MAQHYAANDELAKNYRHVRAASGSTIDNIEPTLKLIRGASVDIGEFYRVHGSLAGLGIRGIASTTISYLEQILKDGPEKAAQTFNDNLSGNLAEVADSSYRASSARRAASKSGPSD